MADNVTIPLTGAGDSTAIVATDEVGSAHYQYNKLAFGADGTATKVSSSDPLPVSLPAATVTTLTPPAAITGFALEAGNIATAVTRLTSILAALPAALAAGGGLKVEGVAGGVAVPVSGTMKPSYGASANNTITLHNLASDASFLAGAEGTEVDLSSYLGGAWISGQITVGTSPTANKEIRVYLIGKLNDSTWPDVFDGTASAETITSAGIRDSIARLVAVIAVDSTTSDRAYPFGPVWVPAVFGAAYPPKVVVPFVTHNTGVNTKNDAAAHFISFTKMNGTITT